MSVQSDDRFFTVLLKIVATVAITMLAIVGVQYTFATEDDLARCEAEQTAAGDLLRAGHPDKQGLEICAGDWLAEEAILRRDGKDA